MNFTNRLGFPSHEHPNIPKEIPNSSALTRCVRPVGEGHECPRTVIDVVSYIILVSFSVAVTNTDQN